MASSCLISEKVGSGALDQRPMLPQHPPAQLECGTEWQISAASATIVSRFSLETNRTRPDLRASPEARLHLNSKYTARLQAAGLVQPRIVWQLSGLLARSLLHRGPLVNSGLYAFAAPH